MDLFLYSEEAPTVVSHWIAKVHKNVRHTDCGFGAMIDSDCSCDRITEVIDMRPKIGVTSEDKNRKEEVKSELEICDSCHYQLDVGDSWGRTCRTRN
jgi:hypothetical protein